MFEKKVFISHSSKNKEIADHLCAFIARLGVKEKNLFCSSVVGQGIGNGEKLNTAIASAIKNSSLLIFLLSYDFLNSSYCMEELGVGWYLSQCSDVTCYYLVLPDIELSDLVGFVNSKIDKFTFLDNCHEKEFSAFPSDLYKHLSLKAKGHTSIINAEHVFFGSISTLLRNLQDGKQNKINEMAQYKDSILSLSAALEIEKNRNNFSEVQQTILLEFTKIEREQALLQCERDSIASLFYRFGTINGLTKEAFSALPNEFWFDAVQRYIGLNSIVKNHSDSSDMENFIATVYLLDGNFTKAYAYFKTFVQSTAGRIEKSDITQFASAYPYTLGEILILVDNALSCEDEKGTHDLLIEVSDFLRERELNLLTNKRN